MNVGYEDLNCADVGRILKLDKTTIAAWCRKGWIKFQDTSGAGSKKARYLISQKELERIQRLMRKYGKRNWLLYNAEDMARVYDNVPITTTYESEPSIERLYNKMSRDLGVEVPAPKPDTVDIPNESEVNQVPIDLKGNEEILQMSDEEYAKEFGTPATESKKCSPDDILNIIIEIQDIKEMIEKLEARKELLKMQIMEVL